MTHKTYTTSQKDNARADTIFQRVLHPNVLFFLGVGQALLPYLIWTFDAGVSATGDGVSHDPIAIWTTAYLCFWIGSRLVPKKRRSLPRVFCAGSPRMLHLSFFVAVALIAQMVWATFVYGAFPLLSYILADGQMDVSTANSLEERSAVGQFGLLIVSTLLANGVLLALLLWSSQTKRKPYLIIAFTFVLMLGNLINGKRQGVLITLVYTAIALTIQTGSPFRNLASLSLLPRNKVIRTGFIFSAVGLATTAMGYVASLRTQGFLERSGIEETIAYLEYPLRNLASQCDQSGGSGPSSFDLLYPLQHFVPAKLVDSIMPSNIAPPTKVERTSPSGMFELIQWSWGIAGVILFSLIIGMLCTYCFQAAFNDFRFLLIYPLMGYSLFTAHSYNHFLNLTVIPVPCFLLWWLGAVLSVRLKPKKVATRTHIANKREFNGIASLRAEPAPNQS